MAIYREPGFNKSGDSSDDPIINRIREAMDSTDPKYLQNLLVRRRSVRGNPQGSYIPGVDSFELKSLIYNASWDPYKHPNLLPGCAAFRAQIAGKAGIVNLKEVALDRGIQIVKVDNSSKMVAWIGRYPHQDVDFSVIILGPEEDKNKNPLPGTEVVWTFFPGEPICQVILDPQWKPQPMITVQEALELGFEWAKIKPLWVPF